MATSKSKSSLNKKPSRVGRPATGRTRSEIEKDAAQKYRNGQLIDGKVPISPFVLTSTRENLQVLKTAGGFATAGDVIDFLVEQEIKRNN